MSTTVTNIPGADEKNARLDLKLRADSGYKSDSTGHRVSANEWAAIMSIADGTATGKALMAAPALLEALEKAATWFEDYAKDHYAKALTAPDSREQHGREVKGKTNKDRAAELRAAISKATGAA